MNSGLFLLRFSARRKDISLGVRLLFPYSRNLGRLRCERGKNETACHSFVITVSHLISGNWHFLEHKLQVFVAHS